MYNMSHSLFPESLFPFVFQNQQNRSIVSFSFRYKYNVKHIKIVVLTGMFYLTAFKLFPSIAVRSLLGNWPTQNIT